ncbi:MAG: type II toxin-antitoxin system prevent-host-death family antitoxin [Candidatus Adiutrix sp.]|jgi:antitoxin (DNA-binding transcriptional repressor) of toxin-antitoxin stability system|nr:type II toxin-antitoxin system prevent-host-death family antitoxin [Candidatus Adiutrix sp.]
MLTINLNEAQERLLELVKQAKDGEGFIIADNDTPLVKVLPYAEPKESRRLGFMRGQGVVGKDVDVKSIGREVISAMFEGRE